MKGSTNVPVVDIVFRKGSKILFVKRQNTGWGDGFYGLPGGHVEAGESFMQAACREALEEVGIRIDPSQLKHGITFQTLGEDDIVRTGIYFEVTDWTGEPVNAEPHVHSEIAWLDENDLPDTVLPNTKLKVEQLKAGESYLEYGWEE